MVEEIEDINIWIPQVKEEMKPTIGMLFDSIAEGSEFYTKYAKEGGFGIRKSSTDYFPKTKKLRYRVFVCAKEGKPNLVAKPLEAEVQRRRSIIRDGCNAAIRFVRKADGKWIITKFREEHNHSLATPHKVHFFPSHRQVTPIKKRLFQQAREANISTSKAIALFGIQSGGYENIGCTEKDIRNLDWKEKQEEKEYDAQNLLDHFKTEQEGNPSFFYAFEIDDHDRLTHCFWADGRARKSYHYFGDVVFDTTYKTNKYSMIFAPFTGINHHGQSTIFGAGFLKNEKTESFVWLFKKFLQAMSNKVPQVIITDQDPAMRAAITEVIPETYHRFCMWHIMNKVTEKLGATAFNSAFIQPFKHCIWNSETPDEFETRWKEVIDINELQGNKWLASLYEIRTNWVPAYSRDIFMAGCRTTQRSESINSFFSNYVRKKNTLVEFYTNFEMAVKRLRHRELQGDHCSINSKPSIKTIFSMEKQMGNIYTRDIFNIFQEELIDSMYYGANPISLDECFITYAVKKEGESSFKEVTYKKENNEARCSCKKFETEGIPCKHILLVLRNHCIISLPEHYVLNRWTINALVNPVFVVDGIELGKDWNIKSPTSTADWLNILHKCILKAKSSTEAGNFFNDMLVNAYEWLDKLTPTLDGEKSVSIPKSISPQVSVRPPDVSKTKGSGKIFKGGKEISMEWSINMSCYSAIQLT